MNLKSTIKTLAGAVLLSCCMPLALNGAPLSPQQALARVQSSHSVQKLPGNQSFVLAHTEKANGENYLYVFNRGNSGFVIASADDRMPAVLGYSYNGSFDPTNASPELKWWLGQYAAQANSYLSSGTTSLNVVTSAQAERPAVAELMNTCWDQAEPYCLDCPMEDGYHCVTGCVATAMAQVIKYHGYPATGNGYHSYSWRDQELVYDYSSAHFDYDNMLDNYNSPVTEAQQQAVANLMYACGVAVDMNYGIGGSGAFDYLVAYALTEYFNYDKDIRFLKRDCYTTEEWDDIVYAEVAAGRPVIYGGQSTEGGHEFVCDGYENGYFHINWGWSGMGNGWFLLSALDPGQQGIGGFDGGYNYDQDIICGIQPNANNPQTTYPIIATGGLVGNVVNNGSTYITMSGNGMLLSYSPLEITTSLYLMAVSSTEEMTVSEGVSFTFPGAVGGSLFGYPGFSISVPQVGPGSYTVYLMYEGPQGTLQRVPIPLSGANHLDMTVDADGNISFSDVTPEQQAKIKVSQLEPISEVISGVETVFNISIENIGEYPYSGAIYIKTYLPDSEDALAEMGIGGLTLRPGSVLSGTVDLAYNLPDGEYVQRCYDMYGEVCSDNFPLVIGHQTVESTGISLDITEKTLTEGESFTLTATIDPENTTDKTITWSSSDPAIATVEDGVVTAVAPGNTTITATTANGLKATCSVTVKAKVIEATGITLDVTEKTLTEGETFTLTATIDPENTTDKTITWSSSDPAVATVEDGVVTAVAPGNATITATTANGLKATCSVTVKAKVIEATGITLDVTEKTLTEGETFTLTATIDPENTTDKTITWSSSDPAVATVEDGIVTAVAPGNATITATTANGLKATCSVTVKAKVIEATGITLDATEKTLTEGETFTLTATIDPENTTDKTITWSSSDPAVATVEDGVVTAVAPGNATITATIANGLKATCAVTVEAKIILATSITLDQTSIEAPVGETVKLVATVLPDDTTDKTVAWSSSDTSIASVDEEGNVTIVANGTATITASTTDGSDLHAECMVYGMTSIEALMKESGPVDIYSLNGLLIRKAADAKYFDTLAKGIYIIRGANSVYKIMK